MAKGTNGYNGGPTVPEKMMALLQDGLPHSYQELQKCQWDELAENVAFHISHLRRQIRPQGYDIFCRQGYYQMVRITASAYSGKR